MKKIQLSVKIQVACLLCTQGRLDGETCPQCQGRLHWEMEMPLEKAVLMFRDYLRVSEQAEAAEKIEAANQARKGRRSPIVLLGEI